ncbi:MAG: glycoside-pentoside-hexuronide (GPH):cation symporter [Clostridiales bacterium]|nr:glycoside-pentoside-hexuronide (GPH):cation symporter [Clostridiales bacterium]
MAEVAVTTDLDAEVILTNKERLFYSFGVVGVIVPFMLPLSFLSFFWTDVVLMPATVVGTFMMLCKLWDAINDPIIGAIVDRSYSPKGRYRQWIVPMGCITNVLCVLLFVKIPGELGMMQYLFSFGVYFIFFASYTALEVPHLSLISSMTTDYQQRGILTSWRQTFASLIMMLISATALPVINAIAPDNPARGYVLTMAIFCAISMPFYFLCVSGVKERVIPSKEEVKVPFMESFKCLKGNVPALCLMGAMLTMGLGAGFGGAGMYFWTYYVGNQMMMALAGTINSASSLLGGPLCVLMLKLIKNKRNIGMLGWTVSAAFGVIALFLPLQGAGLPGASTSWSIYAYIGLSVARGLFGQMTLITIFSTMPDVSEYTKVKYNLRAAGFIVTIIYFFWKLGTSFTQGVLGWVLGALNYAPGPYGSQPDAILNWIRTSMLILPVVFTALGVLCFIPYKLDENTHREMLKTISGSE